MLRGQVELLKEQTLHKSSSQDKELAEKKWQESLEQFSDDPKALANWVKDMLYAVNENVQGQVKNVYTELKKEVTRVSPETQKLKGVIEQLSGDEEFQGLDPDSQVMLARIVSRNKASSATSPKPKSPKSSGSVGGPSSVQKARPKKDKDPLSDMPPAFLRAVGLLDEDSKKGILAQ